MSETVAKGLHFIQPSKGLIIMDTFVRSVLAGQLRHVLTIAAGSLVTVGAIDSSQTESFVAIGSGIVLWCATAAWSYWQKKRKVG